MAWIWNLTWIKKSVFDSSACLLAKDLISSRKSFFIELSSDSARDEKVEETSANQKRLNWRYSRRTSSNVSARHLQAEKEFFLQPWRRLPAWRRKRVCEIFHFYTLVHPLRFAGLSFSDKSFSLSRKILIGIAHSYQDNFHVLHMKLRLWGFTLQNYT